MRSSAIISSFVTVFAIFSQSHLAYAAPVPVQADGTVAKRMCLFSECREAEVVPPSTSTSTSIEPQSALLSLVDNLITALSTYKTAVGSSSPSIDLETPGLDALSAVDAPAADDASVPAVEVDILEPTTTEA
ncbi:hypothetical protein BC834DRAFT_909855 [Gloeopeniophorella convolvens]|nr:hypothetical protein BC834DRAFT_909855 [Gloeopeniophorella convolvens]